MHGWGEIRFGSHFRCADTLLRIEDGIVHVAVKLGGVAVVHQRVHYVALVNCLASCGITQNALQRDGVLIQYLHRHALAEFHSAGGGAQAESLEPVRLRGHVAQYMYFFLAVVVERGEFHRRDNIHVVAFSENCRT